MKKHAAEALLLRELSTPSCRGPSEKELHEEVAALPFRINGIRPDVMLITSRETGRWIPEDIVADEQHERAGRPLQIGRPEGQLGARRNAFGRVRCAGISTPSRQSVSRHLQCPGTPTFTPESIYLCLCARSSANRATAF
jgi:hypothetical protein